MARKLQAQIRWRLPTFPDGANDALVEALGMMRRSIAFVSLLTAIPALAGAQSSSPYAGQDSREIKSLSVDEIKGYLIGDGLGYAKAGELNHFPGPKHVLALGDHLDLTADQRSRIQAIAEEMTAAAIPLGREIVDAERDLDRRFAAGTVDEATLRPATERIGYLQGRLRAVHLFAHLATRKVLSPDQVATYDKMRGYGLGGDASVHDHHR
jgi:Spy/CpxP family protein refolding chaperone